MSIEQKFEFSDLSKAIEDSTGIPDINLFPAVRKWQAAQKAEAVASAIPAEIRAAVVKKLLVSLLSSLFRKK